MLPTASRSPAALRSENVDPSVSSGSLKVALISAGVPSTVAPSAGVASVELGVGGDARRKEHEHGRAARRARQGASFERS